MKEETEQTYNQSQVLLLMELVAREYYKRGQETPKGGMAIDGDALWGIRKELEQKYINPTKEP